jgi:hypothetical protein
MTYDVGNPSPGLGLAHKCGGVKPVYRIPTIPCWYACNANELQILLNEIFIKKKLTKYYVFIKKRYTDNQTLT